MDEIIKKYSKKSSIGFLKFEAFFWAFGGYNIYVLKEILFYWNFENINSLPEIILFFACIPIATYGAIKFTEFVKYLMIGISEYTAERVIEYLESNKLVIKKPEEH